MNKALWAVPALAMLGTASVAAVYLASTRGGEEAVPAVQATATAQAPQPTPVSVGDAHAAELEAIIAEDAVKPRFTGEILGIFVAAREDDLPPEHRARGCSVGGSRRVEWDRVGKFGLSIQMPPQFVYDPDHMNSGVGACIEDDRVIGAGWTYHYREPRFGDYPIGRVTITRSVFASATPPGGAPAEDRVKITEVGGRQAVLIEPYRPDGVGNLGSTGTNAQVIFPEPFGMTAIHAYGVPLSTVLEVAAIVGQATR